MPDQQQVIAIARPWATGMGIKVFDVNKQSLEAAFLGSPNFARSAAVSQDGKTLFVVSAAEDRTQQTVVDEIDLATEKITSSRRLPAGGFGIFTAQARRLVVSHRWPTRVAIYSLPELKE